jgi:hypothetical protein
MIKREILLRSKVGPPPTLESAVWNAGTRQIALRFAGTPYGLPLSMEDLLNSVPTSLEEAENELVLHPNRLRMRFSM